MNKLTEQSDHEEKELLRLASQADQDAFTRLFHQYKNKLFTYVLRLTESEMLAEDIVQNVFLKLWEDPGLLTNIDNFDRYIFRMAKNDATNHFKRMAHETLIVAEIFHHKQPGYNETHELMVFKDVEKALLNVLDKLTPQQKAVYHLSRDEGKTHDEIANLLKISPNTVKNHIVQAMSAVRAQLRKHTDTMLMISTLLILKK